MEERCIEGYEGKYSVTDTGAVYSLNYGRTKQKKELKLLNDGNGYYFVNLCKNNKSKSVRVHRLVAMTFLPKVEGKTEVNHKDGVKTNNNVLNLEWVDHSENQIHAYAIGLNENIKKATSIPIVSKDIKTGEVIHYPSAEVAAKIISCDPSSIRKCCKGDTKFSHGCYWWYLTQFDDDEGLARWVKKYNIPADTLRKNLAHNWGMEESI